MPDTTYEFKMRAVAVDKSGYYHPRWDRAQDVTVRAATKQQAVNKADVMLGPTGRGYGWAWNFRIQEIREVDACRCRESADPSA